MKWKVHQYALLILGWPFRMIWRLFRGTDGKLRKFASWTEKSGYFQILKLLEVAAIFVTIITFQMDVGDRKVEREDRKADSHNQAWSLIASVSGNTDIGNIGVGNALEILNKDGVSLDEIHLPGAELTKVDLSKANLGFAHFEKAIFLEANLSGARLSGANFSGAFLRETDLSGVDLTRANLSGANLTETDFLGAFLRETDLSGAYFLETDLSGVDLSGADLRTAKELTQAQIDSTCYRKEIGEAFLPDGFSQPPECPKKGES